MALALASVLVSFEALEMLSAANSSTTGVFSPAVGCFVTLAEGMGVGVAFFDVGEGVLLLRDFGVAEGAGEGVAVTGAVLTAGIDVGVSSAFESESGSGVLLGAAFVAEGDGVCCCALVAIRIKAKFSKNNRKELRAEAKDFISLRKKRRNFEECVV